MSLLNDALRKNKLEKSQNIKLDFPSQDTRSFKRNTLITLICCIVLISGFGFSWFFLNNNFRESMTIKTQTLANDDIPIDVKIPEDEVSEPEVSEEVVIEKKNDPVFAKKETVLKVFAKNNEQVTAPPISRTSEVKAVKEKEVKTKEVLKTEITNDVEGYYRKALQFHRQGRLEKASSMYKKVLSYDSEHFDTLFNLASIYITISKYNDAYNILNKLVSDNLADSHTILNLAVTEIGLGKNNDALVHLNSINEDDPELRFKMLFHKGVALSHLDEQDDALSCYKDAEKLDPDNRALLLNMAVLYDRLGNYNEAISYYLKLIASDTSDSYEKDKFRQRIETLRNNVSKYPVNDSPGKALGKA